MSNDAQFLIYFCVGMALVTFWHWIEKMKCLNIPNGDNLRDVTLLPDPQASPAAGYRHVIDILPEYYLGLDKDILKSIPTFSYDTSTAGADPPMECPVCLSLFEEKDNCRELPACKHVFHAECIDMWFYSRSSCPLCRANVESPVQPVQTQPVVV